MIKKELVYPHHFRTRAEARLATFEHIEICHQDGP